jgi:UDP-glucose 4-epimerase
MSRILVTGANGFIGTRLVEMLINENFTVIQTDIVLKNPDVQYLDVTRENCKQFFKENRPDVIIHLAAQTDVITSVANPISDLEINTFGTLNLLMAASEANVENFIYINSGGAIYDSNQQMPISETGHVNPVSPYGLSKLFGEYYLKLICDRKKMSWTSLALSNCYGPVRTQGKGVIFEFWNRLNRDEPIYINGAQTSRDFIYVDDVVDAIIHAISKPSNCRINISSGREVTLVELFEILSDLMNKSTTPIFQKLDEREVSNSCLDNTLAKSLLDWAPRYTLRQGLKMSIAKC